jgi:hypothetical protein
MGDLQSDSIHLAVILVADIKFNVTAGVPEDPGLMVPENLAESSSLKLMALDLTAACYWQTTPYYYPTPKHQILMLLESRDLP